MSLSIKHSGTWQTASEVHIKQDGAWKKCTEVYINKDGSWKPMLYALATETITTAGAGTITVPAGVFRATVELSGGAGGKGGYDGGYYGGDGGLGATLIGSFDVTPYTVLSYVVATAGGNGASGTGNAGGAGGTGASAGGAGGSTGVHGWSGSGGGGGGSSSISMPDTTIIMVAGGGSGGGGRGNQAHLSQSAINGKDSKLITSVTSSLVAKNGSNGANCGTADGGAGGGGGGGVIGPTSSKNYTVSSTHHCWGGGWFHSRHCAWTRGSVTTKYSSISAISIATQHSSQACTLNSTYGVTGGEVWTTDGCRATFTVTGTENTGAGGRYMGSYDSDGYPGEAGASYYNADLSTTITQALNAGAGSIRITWLLE